MHVHHPDVTYERARYLSCLWRRNLADVQPPLAQGLRCLPLAALFAIDPLSTRPVLHSVLNTAQAIGQPAQARRWYAALSPPMPPSHAALPRRPLTPRLDAPPLQAHPRVRPRRLRRFAQYSEVVVGASLRLWLCYGVTLELHGQNTLLALDAAGGLAAVVCREVAGGAYCLGPLLLANGYELRPQVRTDALFLSLSLVSNLAQPRLSAPLHGPLHDPSAQPSLCLRTGTSHPHLACMLVLIRASPALLVHSCTRAKTQSSRAPSCRSPS